MQKQLSKLLDAAMLVALVMVTLPAGAQPTASNGCGSGWNTYLVPDSINLAGCTFKNACDLHDTCYGLCEKTVIAPTDTMCIYRKCRKDGELFRKAICEEEPYRRSEIDARKRKVSCDGKFYVGLRALNKNKTICEAFSVLYLKAVEKFGLNAFKGAVPEGGKEGELPFNESSRKAIERFFETADEQQLARLIQELDKEKPSIDLSKPLKYVPGVGLRNNVIE